MVLIYAERSPANQRVSIRIHQGKLHVEFLIAFRYTGAVKSWRTILWFSWTAILLAACGEAGGGETAVSTVNSQQPTKNSQQVAISPQPSAISSQSGTQTPSLIPSQTMTAITIQPQALGTPALTPHSSVLSPSPTSTPNPYADYTIDALAAREYGGGELNIVNMLEETEMFTRYLITYPSDGLTIYGFMNVPHEGSKFPVAIVLHGYVDPADYETIAYTRRYADALAEAGYFVIHPSLRNYPPSDEGPNAYRVGFAVDVLNLIAVIREQSQDPTGYLRRADADRIHLWGHSMGGGVALRVITVNNAPYIRAAVLYAAMSGDEQQNFEQIQVWTNGRSGTYELSAPPDMLQAISPIYHLDRITAPVSIHHSEADDVVPIAWSNDLCARLQALNHAVECHTYYAMPHTFRGESDKIFMERVAHFFDSN